MADQSAIYRISVDVSVLRQGHAADLSDKIRKTLARIGRGNASAEEVANIKNLIDDRIGLATKRGLLAAHTRAEQAAAD